jgi:hypothetical protein
MMCHDKKMKRYSISRVLLFHIITHFDFQITHAGELFVEAVMTEKMATEIETMFPGSILLL